MKLDFYLHFQNTRNFALSVPRDPIKQSELTKHLKQFPYHKLKQRF